MLRRRQAAEALVMRLMSASTAATAVITAERRSTQPPHGGGELRNPFACFKRLVDECGRERAREPDPEHKRQASG